MPAVARDPDLLMGVTGVVAALRIALFTWVAVIGLRDRRWAVRCHLAAIPGVVALGVWIDFASRVP